MSALVSLSLSSILIEGSKPTKFRKWKTLTLTSLYVTFKAIWGIALHTKPIKRAPKKKRPSKVIKLNIFKINSTKSKTGWNVSLVSKHKKVANHPENLHHALKLKIFNQKTEIFFSRPFSISNFSSSTSFFFRQCFRDDDLIVCAQDCMRIL